MTRSSHSSQARRATPRAAGLRMRPLLLALCGAGCMSAALAQLPPATEMPQLSGTQQTGGPVAGVGSFNTEGSTAANPVQNYSQSSSVAVWHFDKFSIGSAGTVNNTALRASDLTVFRVIGSDRSQLAGALNTNNRLILINRNGIHAHRGATFGGAGSLVLSAHELDPSLSANNYEKLLQDPTYVRFVSDASLPFSFSGYGTYGDIDDVSVDVEDGVTMVAGDGGSIMLVGDRVRNQGSLQANGGGSVGLVAAGSAEMQMDVGDSGFIKLVSYDRLSAEGEGDNLSVRRVAVNTGTIEAQGGSIDVVQANLSDRGNESSLAPLPNVVGSRFGEYSPNGVYNTGSIAAVSAEGRQGSVTLMAKGEGAVAVNAGTIDASAVDADTGAGSIRMSAANVLLGADGDGLASLSANGPSGGGSITLDTLSASAGIRGVRQIYTSSASSISANATEAGDGGRIVMTTASLPAGSAGERVADMVNQRIDGLAQTGQIVLRGQIEAVGSGGGLGGTLITTAPVVNTRDAQQAAQINLGGGGIWRLVSNNVFIGSSFFGGEGGLNETFIDPADISAMLDGGTHVLMQAQHSGASGSNFEEGLLYIEPGAGIARETGTQDVDLVLTATNDLIVAGGAEITSGAGPLNVTLVADADKNWESIDRPSEEQPDGRGSLIIGEADSFELLAVGVNTVLIDTNGGDLTLDGAGRPPANLSDDGATNRAGVDITNAELDAGAGAVAITGFGGATPSEGESQNGVSIANAEISGGSVTINGFSTSATGVAITNAEVQARSGPLTVVGLSEGGNDVGQHIGVDIQDNVVFTAGDGGLKVHGMAYGGAQAGVGLRIKSLTIVTTSVPAAELAAPLIALAGQSTQTGGPGMQILGGGQGLIVQGPSPTNDPEGEPLTSIADIVIGANADDAAQALVLGEVAPQFNTSGRINIRPVSLEINNPSEVEALNDKAIHIGSASASGTNFNIDPRWLGLPASVGTASAARYVVGSNTHTGRITVDAGALDGAGIVTLQNQGAGSQGIRLGAQFGIRQLNLLSSGPIAQVGALDVDVLNILASNSSDVQLTAEGNRFGTLNFDGVEALPDVTPAAITNSGAEDIAGFDTGAPDFQRLTISAVTTGPNEEVIEEEEEPVRPIDRTFEGTDLLNELRTDVYVHGQLSRPQLCTPADTAGGVTAVGDRPADSLATEWVKVRKGPQLTNCAGMKSDSSCSAF